MASLAISMTATVNGRQVAQTTFDTTATGLIQVEETVPAQVDETPGTATITFPVDVSEVAGLFLLATGGDVSLDFGDDELELKDGCPVVWVADQSVGACPLTENVSTVTATNTGAAAVSLVMAVVQDATP